ncbi:MAG: tetratricopeptide repeat protein [Bacteroidota bacterium]
MAKQQIQKSKQKKQTAGSFWNLVTRVPLVYLVFFLIAFLIYGQVLQFYLGKFDEDLLILGNLNLIKDLSNLKLAFLTDAFMSDRGVSFYRPLQTVTYMIDAQFFHERGSVFYFTNILLHAATCSALFYLLTMLGKNRKAAFVFTLLFLSTPLFVQAIAWAPSRGDLLIGLTGILSLVFFIKMNATRKYRYGAFTLVAFFAAMFSKETAIFIPLLILLYYLFVEKNRQLPVVALLALCAGFLVIIAAYFYMRFQVVKLAAPAAEFGIAPLFHNLRTIPEYVAKFFLPFNLSPMSGFTLVNTIIGVLLLGILTVVFIRFSSGPYMKELFAIAWFLVFALPGLMYSHTFGSAAYDYLEHRAYLPMAGIIMLMFFLYDGVPEGKAKSRIPGYTILLALILAVYSFIYAGNYENPMIFYNYTIKSNPASAMALSNRGLIRADLKDFQGAIADYDQALALKHDYSRAYVNKGIALSTLKDPKGAIEQYNEALKYEPDLFQSHFNKANAQSGLHLYNEALAEYTIAIRLYPSYAAGYSARASTYSALQNYREADKDYSRAIEIDSKNSVNFADRGKIRYNLNDQKGACADWTVALSLGNSEARDLLEKYCK